MKLYIYMWIYISPFNFSISSKLLTIYNTVFVSLHYYLNHTKCHFKRTYKAADMGSVCCDHSPLLPIPLRAGVPLFHFASPFFLFQPLFYFFTSPSRLPSPFFLRRLTLNQMLLLTWWFQADSLSLWSPKEGAQVGGRALKGKTSKKDDFG